MRWHIRRITRRHKLGISHEDIELDVDRIRFGRGTDVDVHLPDLTVALHHAEFSYLNSSTVACITQSRAGIWHRGVNVGYAELALNEYVYIGRYKVTFIKSESLADVALEIESTHIQYASIQDPQAKRSVQSKFTKRRLAFWASAAIIVMFLILPATTWIDPHWRNILRRLDLVSDAAWNSGPLSSAHHILASRCESCHTKLFRRTQNSSCTHCHDDTFSHASGRDTEERCGSCHREHNGAISLVETDASDCTRCHLQIQQSKPKSSLAVVGDFDINHPQFSVALPGADGRIIRTRLASDAVLSEHSGLIFNHQAHLDPNGLKVGAGIEQLECSDCHRPVVNGTSMQAVRMEEACQRCHRLDFDAATTQELPHADGEVVLRSLREFYAIQALSGGYTSYVRSPSLSTDEVSTISSPAPMVPDFIKRRRPGVSLSEPDRIAAHRWANDMTKYVAEEIIRYRACGKCHELTLGNNHELPQVKAVRIPADWMPAAEFNHAKHETMACGDCHMAQSSNDSRDVLLPRIEMCRECHGGNVATTRIQSVCSDCHRYHSVDQIAVQK